jgi:rSAM/selenodomain-associated transferase 1
MSIAILQPAAVNAAEIAGRADVCALTVMAKAPRAGKVKTRLSPPLTLEQTAAMNVCFLRDTTENMAGVAGAAGLISYTPVGDEALFEGLLPEGFALVAQRDGDFGQRLLGAAEDILACGFGSVCLIDSDSPTVPREAFAQAVEELGRDGDRIVLGPSADGGYYLIGLKQAHAAVFEGIAWSTGTVYEETCERARGAGIEVVELALWYDVDDAATLEMLKAELLAGIQPGFALGPGYGAPHTRRLLMEMDMALNADGRLAADAGGAVNAAVDQQERPPAALSGEGA